MLLPDLPDEGVEDVVDVPAVRGRRLDEPAAELVGERLPLLRTHAPLPALLQVHLVAHQDHRNVVGRTNLHTGLSHADAIVNSNSIYDLSITYILVILCFKIWFMGHS